MYQSGMSTREIGKFIERILGSSYSPTTISNITDATIEDIRKWQQRPLNKRYSVLYLDGLYIKVRRDTYAKEVIYIVLGVNEDGYREKVVQKIRKRSTIMGKRFRRFTHVYEISTKHTKCHIHDKRDRKNH